MFGGRDERVDDLYFEDQTSEGQPSEEGLVRYVSSDLRALLDGVARSITKVSIEDDGVQQGDAYALDFVGGGVTATVAADKATITVSTTGLPPATCCGQVLHSIDGVSFTPQLPLTAPPNTGWLVNDSGHLLVVG